MAPLEPAGSWPLESAESLAVLASISIAAHTHGTEGINAASEAGIDTIEHAQFVMKGGVVHKGGGR